MAKPKQPLPFSEDRVEEIALAATPQTIPELTELLRHIAPTSHVGRPLPRFPTAAGPGTAAKLEIFQARFEEGVGLWHPDDAKDRSVTNELAAAGQPIRNGSNPLECLRWVDEHAFLTAAEIDERERERAYAEFDAIARKYLCRPHPEQRKAS